MYKKIQLDGQQQQLLIQALLSQRNKAIDALVSNQTLLGVGKLTVADIGFAQIDQLLGELGHEIEPVTEATLRARQLAKQLHCAITRRPRALFVIKGDTSDYAADPDVDVFKFDANDFAATPSDERNDRAAPKRFGDLAALMNVPVRQNAPAATSEPTQCQA
jgi:hypothetical protein